MHGAGVPQGVHRVEAQPVHAHLLEPEADVVQDEPAHLVRVGAVQVQAVAPAGAALTQIRPEHLQVVAGGAQVVVHDVLDHAEAGGVGGGHEAAVGGGAAVGLVDGEPRHPVVAPVPRPGEGVHGQQLDVGDPEVRQVRQAGDGGVEGPLGREGPHVQLVEDGATQAAALGRGRIGLHPGRPGPALVLPREGAAGDVAAGGPVDRVGLAAGAGVRHGVRPVHAVAVAGVGRRLGGVEAEGGQRVLRGRPPASGGGVHGHDGGDGPAVLGVVQGAGLGVDEDEVDALCVRRPHCVGDDARGVDGATSIESGGAWP